MKINTIADEVVSSSNVDLTTKEMNALHTRIYNYLKRENIKHRKRGRAVEVTKIDAEPVIEHFSQQLRQKMKAKTAVNDAETVQNENEKLKKKIAELEEENAKLHKRVEFLNNKVIGYADLMQDKLEELNENKDKKDVKNKNDDSGSSKRKCRRSK